MLAMTVGRELADGQGVFLFRENYGDIVCYSAMKSIGPAVCTLPAVEKLAGLDAADGTEYLATLRAYLSAFQDRAAAAKALSIAERDLPAFIPRSVCMTSGQILLVMLFDLEKSALSRDSQSALLTQLDIFVRKYQLYCGLSSVFRDLSQRRNYKHQAMGALRLGARSNPAGYLFRADELYTEVMLSEAVKRAGKQILTLSDVTALVKYDTENKTSYLNTLRQYLRCNGRIAAAAKSIFIDRGTMKYRLQKILDLMQIDFDQPETARLLRLGIAIYNAAKGDPET